MRKVAGAKVSAEEAMTIPTINSLTTRRLAIKAILPVKNISRIIMRVRNYFEKHKVYNMFFIELVINDVSLLSCVF